MRLENRQITINCPLYFQPLKDPVHLMRSASDVSPLEHCRTALRLGLDSDELKLPVLPKIAGEILALVSDANAQMGDLAALIEKDQVLAGYVIKVANTATKKVM